MKSGYNEIFKTLLVDYMHDKHNYLYKHNEATESIFYQYSFFNKNCVFQTYSNLLANFALISKNSKEKNNRISSDFNALSFFQIDEQKHSFLLSYLLNPNESHGQGNLFLAKILEKLGIEKHETTNWTVTAEKGRIDILLTRINPHSIIIIENKSNRAIDQPNQLYRYWYYQIHKRKLQIDYSNEEYKKRYQIIYLAPDPNKIPADNSLTRPEKSDYFPDYDELPPKVPIEPKIWEFSKQIVECLESSILLLNKDNHRMKEYLNQYIEIILKLK